MPHVRVAAGSHLPSIRVQTVNSAARSKGSIHDDEKARELGYAGGFVPGTTVLGYMTRLMHEIFGKDWLQSAQFNGRLRRPLYEGIEATVEATVLEAPNENNGGRVEVELRVLDPDGAVVALATASCRTGRDG